MSTKNYSNLDPFSQVHSCIWDMAEASPTFKKYVRVGNRIKFDGETTDPVKRNVNAGDLPEVTLVPQGISTSEIHKTSSSTNIVRRWQWLIATDDLRLWGSKHGTPVLPLEWEVFRVLTTWCSTLTTLTWAGNNFVKRVDLVNSDIGQSNNDLQRGVKGWSSLITFELEMYFRTSDLKALN